MRQDEPIAHLSQIQTHWSMIFQAHQGASGEASAAQEAMMLRYGGAVHRYLLGITRDPELANDLAQEFALRFLRGDFRKANPRFGRFRNFVKTSVLNLVIDHHRRTKTRPQAFTDDVPEVASPGPNLAELDRKFLDCWREELLEHAWSELERLENRTGQPFYSVLRLRADKPEMRSHELADLLTVRLGRPVNAGWVRQTLLRARERFVSMILEEVSRSMQNATEDQINEELMDLGLWDYCRDGRKV